MAQGSNNLVPLITPPTPAVFADTVISGKPRPAIDLIQLFSPEEWEDFVLEWADSLRGQYKEVLRFAGAGDMGRDICGFYETADPGCEWDNYQCKHYDAPLTPSEIWVELGKLCYYTHTGNYSIPKNYYFVAPKGCGSKLSTLLKSPEKVRSGLIENWERYCENNICATSLPLTGNLLLAVESFDFSIVKPLPVLRVIEQHKRTRWHVARFGAGLPEREAPPLPPPEIGGKEIRYVEQLLEAYSDHLKITISIPADLKDKNDIEKHFQRSREQFYSAEALKAFSIDTLPPGQFERLQKEIHDGVIDTALMSYSTGFDRVNSTINQSRVLQITSHPLISRLLVNDRCGICHQLANENKLTWVK